MEKVKELSVRLNGLEVGILKLTDGKMEFNYNSDVQNAISLSMPLRYEPYKHKACLAFFGGFLPENIEIKKIIARKYNIDYQDDFKLLKEIGRDCAGAVSFHLVNEKIVRDEYKNIDGIILSDDEVIEKIKQLPQNPFAGGRLSLAGAQTKTAFCVIDGKFALPNNNVPTTHIVKPAIFNYKDSIQNEFMCLKIANEIGILTTEVEIKQIKDFEFLLIKRFDRLLSENKDYIIRIAQEDFAQALGILSTDKYEATFKDCLRVINQTSNPAKNKQEFVKQVIFNFLVGNNDAHSKNFSILYRLGNIELAPAYDILCTEVYGCDANFAMKIGNAKSRENISKNDWIKLSNDLDLSVKIIEQELERQKNLLPDIAKKYAEKLNSPICDKIYEIIVKNCKKTDI